VYPATTSRCPGKLFSRLIVIIGPFGSIISAYTFSGFTFFFKHAPGCFRTPGAGICLAHGVVKINATPALSDSSTIIIPASLHLQARTLYSDVQRPRHSCFAIRQLLLSLQHPSLFVTFLVSQPRGRVSQASTPGTSMPRHCAFCPCKLFRDSHNVILILQWPRSLEVPTCCPDQRMAVRKSIEYVRSGSLRDEDVPKQER
jgi:hypothetical protein